MIDQALDVLRIAAVVAAEPSVDLGFRLREIAEIVHDIDLKDAKFHRLEAAGFKAIINGLSEVLRDDRKLLQQCIVIFDGLYGLLGQSAQKDKSKRNLRRQRRAVTPHTDRYFRSHPNQEER